MHAWCEFPIRQQITLAILSLAALWDNELVCFDGGRCRFTRNRKFDSISIDGAAIHAKGQRSLYTISHIAGDNLDQMTSP